MIFYTQNKGGFMIDFNYIDIDEFNAKYKVASPEQSKIKYFGKKCADLIECTQTDNEEFQKNEINDMLEACFEYKCNVKDKIDSCIYDEGIPKVLIEVKQLSNKTEFPKTKDNPLSKAFVQSIFYFLKEHLDNKNNEIKHIIICNPISFFIFDANEFIIFKNDSTIKKLYKNTTNGTDKSREKFYKDLISYLSSEFNQSIKYTHFELNNKTINDDSILSKIYQLLSLQVLLKQKRYIDSNTLNKDFYNELLYILGLKQTNKNGVFVIDLSDEANTLSDLIAQNLKLDKLKDFESIFSLITTWNNRILFLRLLESMLLSFNHIKKVFLDIGSIPNFQVLQVLFFEVLAKKEDSRNTDVAQFSNIPYLNSSLFEKTKLEKDGKEIKLLDSKYLRILQNSILRKDNAYKEQYANKETLPFLEYLFSFLHAYNFTTTPKDIINNIKINNNKLINSAVLGLIFEKLNGYKEGSFYTPSFITNYMCKQSLQQVVIQKFNTAKNWDCADLQSLKLRLDKLTDSPDGYKEANEIFDSIKVCDPAVGSGHFLVSMLNNMIELKFHLKILCDENFERLKDIQLRLENDEIVLQDSTGNPHIYQIPSHQNIESHKLQKAIFHNKRTLIESCLFGVDINHNSCEITKLRLWIELLKYSYYIFENGKNTNTLQTLPNIDINIKCGNSLVSNFPLDSHFTIAQTKDFANNLKTAIDEYKTHVELYKDALKDKDSITAKIHSIKTLLKTYLLQAHASNARLIENLHAFVSTYGEDSFDIETPFGMEMIKIIKKKQKEGKGFRFQPTLESLEPKALDKQGENLLSLLYKDFEFLESMRSNDAFEWRFAFPEVLDNNGDFLGFDLVIGNPPYIRQEEIKHLKPHLKKAFSIYKGTSDIYTYFFEQGYKILKPKALLSFITSNKYTRAGYGEPLRAFILANTQILHYIDLNGLKIFDSATVDTSIITFAKTPPSQDSFDYLAPTQPSLDTDELHAQPLHQSSLSKDSFIFQDQANQALKAKIESLGTPLKDWDISINYGIKTGYNEAFIIDSAKREEILNNCKDKSEKTRTSKLIKKMLRGRDIKRYGYEWAGLWLICTFPSLKLDIDDYPALKTYLESFRPRIDQSGEKGCRKKTSNKWFETQDNIAYHEEFEKEKIVYPNMSSEFVAMFDQNNFYTNQKCFTITLSQSENTNTLLYLTAILNSKTNFWFFKQIGATLGASGYEMSKIFVEKLPIPKIDSTNKALSDEIISLVEQILQSKVKDPTKDTKELESRIDSLVYKLYHLTDDEIKIIKGK